MGSLEIRPVHSTGDLRRFIGLPYRLYRDEPNWVAPLRFERRQFLDRRKNPFFEHGRAEYFLALRDGRVVGRVSAQVDDNFQAFQENSWGWFGFFECENDPEAAAALLERADQWLRGQGCDRMVGPADFTTNDECGVLLEGHDRTPLILSPWTHRYYPELLEGAGMAKAMDLLMWELHISGRDKVNPVIWKLADQVEERHGVTVRPFRKKDIEAEISRFMEVYNSAWEKNWGFVPITDDEIAFQAKALKQILVEEWAFIARHTLIGERILGAAIALRPVAKLVRSSHERVDGGGYPDGLAGDAIPLGARIVAVCDAYDAMTSDRPYQRRLGHDDALVELRRCAGTQFDPVVVEAFCRVSARETADAAE